MPPDQTRSVSGKADDRREHSPHETFDFLGYTLRARRSKNRWGKYFVNFRPGGSKTAAKAIRQTIRGWQLAGRMDKKVDDLARMFNPSSRGWITYDGRDDKSALYPTLRYLDRRVAHRNPGLFAHWRLLYRAAAGQSEPDEPRGSRPDL